MSRRRAFTLVELLVVIAIIGVLVAILLPAVQSAREAARKTQCRSNLRQLALAWHAHLDVHGHFPTGGWAGGSLHRGPDLPWHRLYTGDPDRGYGKKQPGNWTYNILPYIEEGALRELGADGSELDGVDVAVYQQRASTPIPSLICPSRGGPLVIDVPENATGVIVMEFRNVKGDASSRPERLAVLDYAANSGGWEHPLHYPLNYRQGDDPNWFWRWSSSRAAPEGVCFVRSQIRPADIRDGTTNTYMIGEKFSFSRNNGGLYTASNGNVVWDLYDLVDQFCGTSRHARRWANPEEEGWLDRLPMRDTQEWGHGSGGTSYRFGSAHDAGCHMAFCDGSVRTLSYSIDWETHYRLGSRYDGLPIDTDAVY